MAKVVLPKPFKWNAGLVTRIIFERVFKNSCMVAVPNCYWTGFEADLLVVEKGMRLIDVEVKISRSDLKADLKKDKWWYKPGWRQHGPPQQNAWPPKVWKHYYAMPASIWKPELAADVPACSGILLLADDKYAVTVERAAKPNRGAPTIGASDAVQLARLSNFRLWEAQHKLAQYEGA